MEFTRLNDGLYKAFAKHKHVYLIVSTAARNRAESPIPEAQRLAKQAALQLQFDEVWHLGILEPKNGLRAKVELASALNDAPHDSFVVMFCQNAGIHRAALRLIEGGQAIP